MSSERQDDPGKRLDGLPGNPPDGQPDGLPGELPGGQPGKLAERLSRLLPTVFPPAGQRALLLCSGDPPSPELMATCLQSCSLLICTDGAGHPHDELPRIPDIVIGDGDSCPPATGDEIPHDPRRIRIDEQETTDSEKALLHLAEEGFSQVLILGAGGGRLDHTLYNLNLLERFSDRLQICLCDDHQLTVRIGAGEDRQLEIPPDTTISLLPLHGPVTGLTVTGTVWPLTSGELQVGGPATISNRVAHLPLRVEVDWGSLILMVSLATSAESPSPQEHPLTTPAEDPAP
jgi:thiamine pyrophosphokinase